MRRNGNQVDTESQNSGWCGYPLPIFSTAGIIGVPEPSLSCSLAVCGTEVENRQVVGRMVGTLTESRGNDITFARIIYGLVCLDTLCLLVFPTLFYVHRRAFPIIGRTQSLYWFLTCVIYVCMVYGHLNTLLPSPGIPCSASVLVLSLVQNWTAATLLFSAWSLFFRNQLKEELEQFRQRLHKLPFRAPDNPLLKLAERNRISVLLGLKTRHSSVKTVPQLNWRKPISTWYQRHRQLTYPSAFWLFVIFITVLCLLLWVLMMSIMPSIRTRLSCQEATTYAYGLVIVFFQGLWIVYLAYRISGQHHDNYGLKRELSGIAFCFFVLMMCWVVVTLWNPELSNYYNLQSVLLYSGFFVVLMFSYADPVVRALWMKRQLSVMKLMQHKSGNMTIMTLLQGTNPVFTSAFVDFIAKEFSLENYLFWREVEDICVLYKKGPKEPKKKEPAEQKEKVGNFLALPKATSSDATATKASRPAARLSFRQSLLPLVGMANKSPLAVVATIERLSIFPSATPLIEEPKLVAPFPHLSQQALAKRHQHYQEFDNDEFNENKEAGSSAAGESEQKAAAPAPHDSKPGSARMSQRSTPDQASNARNLAEQSISSSQYNSAEIRPRTLMLDYPDGAVHMDLLQPRSSSPLKQSHPVGSEPRQSSPSKQSHAQTHALGSDTSPSQNDPHDQRYSDPTASEASEGESLSSQPGPEPELHKRPVTPPDSSPTGNSTPVQLTRVREDGPASPSIQRPASPSPNYDPASDPNFVAPPIPDQESGSPKARKSFFFANKAGPAASVAVPAVPAHKESKAGLAHVRRHSMNPFNQTQPKQPSIEAVFNFQKKVISEINRVYLTYVVLDAEREVNLPGDLKQKIQQSMEHLDEACIKDTEYFPLPPTNLQLAEKRLKRQEAAILKAKAALVYAQKNCYMLMKTDTYNRFVQYLTPERVALLSVLANREVEAQSVDQRINSDKRRSFMPQQIGNTLGGSRDAGRDNDLASALASPNGSALPSITTRFRGWSRGRERKATTDKLSAPGRKSGGVFVSSFDLPQKSYTDLYKTTNNSTSALKEQGKAEGGGSLDSSSNRSGQPIKEGSASGRSTQAIGVSASGYSGMLPMAPARGKHVSSKPSMSLEDSKVPEPADLSDEEDHDFIRQQAISEGGQGSARGSDGSGRDRGRSRSQSRSRTEQAVASVVGLLSRAHARSNSTAVSLKQRKVQPIDEVHASRTMPTLPSAEEDGTPAEQGPPTQLGATGVSAKVAFLTRPTSVRVSVRMARDSTPALPETAENGEPSSPYQKTAAAGAGATTQVRLSPRLSLTFSPMLSILSPKPKSEKTVDSISAPELPSIFTNQTSRRNSTNLTRRGSDQGPRQGSDQALRTRRCKSMSWHRYRRTELSNDAFKTVVADGTFSSELLDY
eukprot:g81994.t1